MQNQLQTLIAAATSAAHKHRDQRRKGAEASPYINHPLSVADILDNEGAQPAAVFDATQARKP